MRVLVYLGTVLGILAGTLWVFISAGGTVIGHATKDVATGASLRYEVVARIEYDGINYTSSAVQELRHTWLQNWGFGNNRDSKTEVFGDAVEFDVPGAGSIFVLMHARRYGYEEVILTACDLIPKSKIRQESSDLINAFQGRCEVPPGDRMPTLVFMSDFNDARTVIPANAKLLSLTLTTTKKPITDVLPNRMPWLEGGSTIAMMGETGESNWYVTALHRGKRSNG